MKKSRIRFIPMAPHITKVWVLKRIRLNLGKKDKCDVKIGDSRFVGDLNI